jgi:hypothetical protein
MHHTIRERKIIPKWATASTPREPYLLSVPQHDDVTTKMILMLTRITAHDVQCDREIL